MAIAIQTEIQITGSPKKVWEVFTNFKEYNDWNPFMTSLEGEVIVGNKIKVELNGMTFKPKVLVLEENRVLEWIGRLGIPGIVDGKHRFELVDLGNDTVRFIQSEKFTGILVPFFKKKLKVDTKEGFIKMNKALKDKVEAS